MERRVLYIVRLGRVEYTAAWELQKKLAAARAAGRLGDTLLLLEHLAVYTLGSAAREEHVLDAGDVPVVRSDRGGDVTYHGPGQLVGYPILDLQQHGGDVIAYIRQLEEVLMRALAAWGVAAGRRAGYTGVWVDEGAVVRGDAPPRCVAPDHKIASIGVKVDAHRITTHGFALNVDVDLAAFQRIVPCGLSDCVVTSLAQLLSDKTPPLHQVADQVAQAFAEVFGLEPRQAYIRETDGGVAVVERRPEWLKVRAPGGDDYHQVKGLLRTLGLHTVCEEAHCPNIGECFAQGTATFLILGDVCTRGCRFCAVAKGQPLALDREEPERVARAVARLGLRHAVITSVTRDDLPDGGASIFAEVIRKIHTYLPGCSVEVLIPDFQGSLEALRLVLAAGPEVLNHNIETVPRLYHRVRPGAIYARSLELLRRAKDLAPNIRTKSGLMMGLGEDGDEVLATLRDLRVAGCDMATIGQYLQPSAWHLPVARFYRPEEFAALRAEALRLGFAHVESGPLVRSSYHAHAAVLKTAHVR
jgi:lipoic acid synthetase